VCDMRCESLFREARLGGVPDATVAGLNEGGRGGGEEN
jgi:hypothetical protein